MLITTINFDSKGSQPPHALQVLLSFYVLLYRIAITEAKGEVFKARRCGPCRHAD